LPTAGTAAHPPAKEGFIVATQAQVEAVYRDARNFFKSTAVAKSYNKRYRDGAPVTTAKLLKRHVGRLYAKGFRDWCKEVTGGYTPMELGQWLHSYRQVAAGNCIEMCCLALYYFDQAALQSQVSFDPSMVCVPEGDHAFLIVGYLPPWFYELEGGQLSNCSVVTLCNSVTSQAECYAVDIWAGICCPLRFYPFEFMTKMRHWASQGKEIKSGDGWLSPTDPEFLDGFVNSPFYISRDATF
jgi:hypothetical protein